VAVPKLKLIVDCILNISAGRGFHAMSLRDLCEATGISMGGIYNYIGSKEQFGSMLIEFVGGTFARVNNDLLPTELSIEERLDFQLRAHLYTAELFRPWYFFGYMETKNAPAELIDQALGVQRSILSILQSLIEEGRRAGIYGDVDSRLVAAAGLSLVEEWFLKRWYFREARIDVQTYADFVVVSVQKLLGVAGKKIG
jgi:AcrR family transcriptional regulator